MNNQFLAFSKIKGLGPKALKEIITYFKAKNITNIFETDLDMFLSGINLPNKLKDTIKMNMSNGAFNQFIIEADNDLNLCFEKNIKVISYYNENYPKYLKLLDDAPMFLYCKGNIDLLNNQNNVAVVGTRNNSDYGKLITQKTVQFLVENDYCIVSGLALGIDTIAHESTLEFSGKTISVLVDVDDIAPKTNLKLAKRILDNGGLLVAENPPKSKIIPALFAKRDRIQTGLSLAVFPIETSLNGGTFHAINTGIKYKRKVFAPDVKRSGYSDTDIPQLEGIKSIIENNQAFAYTKTDYPKVLEILSDKKDELNKIEIVNEGSLF
jgi:DNA processing protein